CPWGRICKDGNCVDDPCFRIKCPYPAVCYDGQCIDKSEVPSQDAGYDFGPPLDISVDIAIKDTFVMDEGTPSSDIDIDRDGGIKGDILSTDESSSSSCSCNLIE
ncbi:MAG: hypothetical protein ACPL7I_05665, partial [Myxococcota bacterium]